MLRVSAQCAHMHEHHILTYKYNKRRELECAQIIYIHVYMHSDVRCPANMLHTFYK
jgi:hypothetical protein